MKKPIVLILVFASGASQAALVDRGGGFIYDDVLDITWLQDANYAQTSGYDADGLMTWGAATVWADGLSVYDSVRNVTYDDWRLPTTPLQDPSCSYQYGGLSYGGSCTASEMAHLFNVDGIISSSPGLFTNFQSFYWSGEAPTGVPGIDGAWAFEFNEGSQFVYVAADTYYAWAVREGDVAASVVPIPAVVWLFASGLGLLGWMRRNSQAKLL